MTGGGFLTPLFFFALFVAAISSLIAMLELATKLIMDYGYSRRRAVILINVIAIICGLPSAYFLKFFNNQDWVWGIGLLVSGFFFIFFTLKTGIRPFIDQYLKNENNVFIRNIWTLKLLSYLMVLEFLMMFIWWFFQSISWYPESWWNPFDQFTIATCMFQWIIVILLGLVFNKQLSNIKIVSSNR